MKMPNSTSSVSLLFTSVDNSQQELRLAFSGVLDLASAGEAWNYRVQVNGEDVGILMLFYNQFTGEVVISLPSGTLNTGDKATVSYKLLDAQLKTLSGIVATL